MTTYFSRSIFLMLLCISLLVSSCTTITSYEFGSPQQHSEPYAKQWAHQFLGYSVGRTHIQTDCPAGQEVVQRRVWLTPGQWFVGLVSFFFIYSPVTVGYWCE